VFQVSPAVASDPAAGKKQSGQKTVRLCGLKDKRALRLKTRSNFEVEISPLSIVIESLVLKRKRNCRRHQIIKCKVCVSSFPSRSFRPCGWEETRLDKRPSVAADSKTLRQKTRSNFEVGISPLSIVYCPSKLKERRSVYCPLSFEAQRAKKCPLSTEA